MFCNAVIPHVLQCCFPLCLVERASAGGDGSSEEVHRDPAFAHQQGQGTSDDIARRCPRLRPYLGRRRRTNRRGHVSNCGACFFSFFLSSFLFFTVFFVTTGWVSGKRANVRASCKGLVVTSVMARFDRESRPYTSDPCHKVVVEFALIG